MSAVASYLLPVLVKQHDVLTMGRSGCDIVLDVTQEKSCLTIPLGTDVIVHLAAAFAGNTDESILETVETNALGSLKSCMAAFDAGVRHFILISSIYTQLL